MKTLTLPLAALLVVILSGCNRDLVKIDPPPKIVRVPVEIYAALPADLTNDCYNEPAKEQTYAEAKRLANLRDASIAECNKRLARIRELQSKP